MNTATRLFIVALLAALLYGSTYVAPAWLKLKPPSVKLPERDFRKMPMQFAKWQGEDVPMDPEITRAIGADVVVDRAYRDDQGHVVSLHTALFANPDEGVYHSPINCYRANGWEKLDDTRLQLQVTEESSIPVSLTSWKSEGERILVMYWYQLGEHIIFDRWGLGGVRLEMRGKETWPALCKVLVQTSAADPEANNRIQSIAKYVYQWINEPLPQPTSDTANQ